MLFILITELSSRITHTPVVVVVLTIAVVYEYMFFDLLFSVIYCLVDLSEEHCVEQTRAPLRPDIHLGSFERRATVYARSQRAVERSNTYANSIS